MLRLISVATLAAAMALGALAASCDRKKDPVREAPGMWAYAHYDDGGLVFANSREWPFGAVEGGCPRSDGGWTLDTEYSYDRDEIRVYLRPGVTLGHGRTIAETVGGRVFAFLWRSDENEMLVRLPTCDADSLRRAADRISRFPDVKNALIVPRPAPHGCSEGQKHVLRLDAAAIEAGLARVEGEVQSCFRRFRAPRQLEIELTIAGDGTVSAATPVGPAARSKTATCVATAAGAATFTPFALSPATIRRSFSRR